MNPPLTLTRASRAGVPHAACKRYPWSRTAANHGHAARRWRRSRAGATNDEVPEADQEEGREVAEPTSAPSSVGEGAPAKRDEKPVTAVTILASLLDAVKRHGRSLTAVYLTTEGVNFLANRAFHRLTNQIAMDSLSIPREAIGNVWWLSQNPELLANGSTYQALTASVFLIAFPVSVLIKAVQSAYFYFILSGGRDSAEGGIPCPENAFRPALAWAAAQFRTIQSMAPSIFTVEFLVSIVVIPLQFASLLVFSLPFTLPIIMSVHVALPVALRMNIKGWKAIQASRAMMKPVLWQAAIPFVGIIVCQRLIDISQGKVIASLPSRFYYELLEIPLGVLGLGFVLSAIASVCRASLPFVLYNMLSNVEREQGSDAVPAVSP